MKEEKRVIGYIYSARGLDSEDRAFINLAKKKNIKLILFNITKKIDEEELIKKASLCDIIFNNSAEDFAEEFIKTLESLRKKVIDSSKAYYYIEDKWLFYLKCKEHNLPVPKTILLSENMNSITKELKQFNCWPVILKRIEGTCGEYVEKANNIKQAREIIKKFWKKGSDKIPVIAQEYIHSFSYRVTAIDNKIVQTSVKKSNNWKCTGVYQKECNKFLINKKLKMEIFKLLKIINIKVCGIDLIKKGDNYLFLEVNTSPGLDFIESERDKLINKIFDLLIKEIR